MLKTEKTNNTAEPSRDFVVDENGVLTAYKGNDTEIVLPAGVRIIGTTAFMCFKGYRIVKKLVVPEGVTEIQSGAFLASYLEEIILPSTLNKIGDSAFCYCESLRSITIPDGITEIAENAFAYSGLEEIHLPEHLEKIGRDAFYKCSSLKKIDLSKAESIEIGDRAFVGCGGLVDGSGMLILQNRLFETAKHHNYIEEDFDIPDHVASIEDNVFTDGRYNLTMSLNCPSWRAEEDEYGNVHALLREGSSSISFRDADGKIVAKVIVLTEDEDENTAEKMLLSIRRRKSGRFDFNGYDRVFPKLENTGNKTQMALVRLQYPYKLTKKMEEMYTSFLRSGIYCDLWKDTIDHQEWDITDDIDTLKALEKYHLLSIEETADLVEYAQKLKSYEFVTELLDYRNRVFGEKNIYQSLELEDDSSVDNKNS